MPVKMCIGDNVPIACSTALQRSIYTAGGMVMAQATEPGTPGLGIHEMGTARMGTDPRTSVLGKFNQAHDVPNLFVSDGSVFTTGAAANPTLTIVALAVRQAEHIVEQLRLGAL